MPTHSIFNKNISISVNSLGAELVSLKSSTTELLWQGDKSIWARFAPVLFPIVGKLKDNEFTHNGTVYNLPQHGFARDSEFVLIEESENVLEFELTANEDTLLIYPFHFSLRIRYELQTNGVDLKYLVFNPDNKELLFSLGAHPGFNCKRVEGESLEDFYIEFENKKELVLEKLSNGLLSGQTSVLKLENSCLKLNSQLFESDALVLKNTQIEKVNLSSTKSKSKIILTCKDWPYFGIWTKKGSDAFVCLEPWYGIADNLNTDKNLESKPGIIRLQANRNFKSEFTIKISE